MTEEIKNAAQYITLLATLKRIKRKAHIMGLGQPRHSASAQDAAEIELLAGIALRCIGAEEQ